MSVEGEDAGKRKSHEIRAKSQREPRAPRAKNRLAPRQQQEGRHRECDRCLQENRRKKYIGVYGGVSCRCHERQQAAVDAGQRNKSQDAIKQRANGTVNVLGFGLLVRHSPHAGSPITALLYAWIQQGFYWGFAMLTLSLLSVVGPLTKAECHAVGIADLGSMDIALSRRFGPLGHGSPPLMHPWKHGDDP